VPDAKDGASERGARLLALLHAAQTAAWLEGDAAEYLALFAPDESVVAARGPEAGAYDVHFSPAAYAALLRNQSRQPVRGPFQVQTPVLEHESSEVHSLAGREVVSVVRHFDGFSSKERVEERFEFVQRAGQWRVVSLWYYPLSSIELTETSYDRAKLPELDSKAERKDQPAEDRAYSLFAALRYAEAADAYCELAKAPKAAAEDWLSCGYGALFAGDPARAEAAFQSAERIDPLLQVPR
jgi:hypothetical protein